MKLIVLEGTPSEFAESKELLDWLRADTASEAYVASIESREEVVTPSIPSDVEKVLQTRGAGGAALMWVRQLVVGVVAQAALELAVGSSQSTPDGLSDYVMVRGVETRGVGALAYFKPKTGVIEFRLPFSFAEGRMFAHRRPIKDTNAYQVRVVLTSEGAVAEALELIDEALREARR